MKVTQCTALLGCVGITQMSPFKCPDQEEAGKCVLSFLEGTMGDRSQWHEEVRRAEHIDD